MPTNLSEILFCSLDQSVYELIVFSKEFSPGGAPHMKGVGMLVVLLRGVKFGFWSHLGCFGQNVIIFSREGLVYGCMQKSINIYIFDMYIFNSFYLLHSYNPSFL